MKEIRDTFIALQDWRATAKRILGKDITFDWGFQKAPLGQYMWQGNKPNKEDMHGFYTASLPGGTGAYDFSKSESSPEEVETFPADIEEIAGYMRDVAAPAMESMATDKYGKPTSRGGYLADVFSDVVG
ncbi:hypothetical protein CABS01_11092 [Colletotrichum abscissum]|uniref:uncharacterized protein n=1 Tax=Colletotrichum abscissum TaxID=1671311 RepID=UPI0027D57F01|nr:uncharacterized protein CABS01_11092 [Colletotrichum abscissum]KAK1496943.1 hypothetical protein CABS01_11092 [Colletotrichum abscissum]